MHKEEDTAGLRDHSTTKENTTKTTPTDLKMPGLIESIQCRECGQNLYRDQSTAAPDESLRCYDCKWTRNHDLVLQHLKGKRFLDNVDEVIENIEDVNAPHKYGQGEYSLLFHCSVANNLQVTQALLRKGADPRWRNRAGNSVLNLYIKRDQHEMAEAAYQAIPDPEGKKAFVNQRSHIGWNALMACADTGSYRMAKWLVSRGANVNDAMESGWTAMHAAAKKGHKDILELLLEKGGDRNLTASHREFGRNLRIEDVITHPELNSILLSSTA